jgi:hypothetical protein
MNGGAAEPEEGMSDGATGRQKTVRQEAQNGDDAAEEGARSEGDANDGGGRSAEAEGDFDRGGEEGCGETHLQALARV